MEKLVVSIESSRFWDEDEYTITRFSQYWVLLTREPASIWEENVIASSFYYEFCLECCSGGNTLSNVRSFIILPSGDGLTTFSINDPANFFGEKKSEMKPSGVSFFKTRIKTLI